MFTGIIQHLSCVASFDRNDFGAVLRVDDSGWGHRPAHGDSIAVNGCCLTVAEHPAANPGSAPHGASLQASNLRFDVIRQTLEATTLGDLKPGDAVNLEHAVTPTTVLGGHIVQGHIDATGRVARVIADVAQHRLRIEPVDRAAMECIVEKGSIAVQGVSLTVAAVGDSWFEVALIPTTLELTNLGRFREGDRVNLETDYIAKIVVNWLRRTR